MVSRFTRRLHDLSADRRALLAATLQSEGLDVREQAILRRPAAPTAPVSFAQQRLWFLAQMEPDSPFIT